MAITKVSQYNSTPTEIADYQAQNNYLQALINQSNGLKNILYQATTEIPTIFLGSYIAMGGTLYIVDTENYTILGSTLSGDNYISVSVSGNNLIATWIQNISSYSWNNVYNYYSDGTNILLPYKVNFDTGYIVNPFNQFTNQNTKTTDNVTFDKINGTTVSTGHGDNELYAMNQNVRTTDDVSFKTVNTGHGDNELYPMNQPVRTTDSPTHAGMTLTGTLLPDSSPTSGSYSIGTLATWTVPRGIYMFHNPQISAITLSINGSSFYGTTDIFTVIADGVNVKIYNAAVSSIAVTYLKF